MEGAPISPRPQSAMEYEDGLRDFLDSSDEEHLAQYKTGRDVLMGDYRYEPFRDFMDDTEYKISDDRLDMRVDMTKSKPDQKAASKDDTEDLDARQLAILEEEKRKNEENEAAAGRSVEDDERKVSTDPDGLNGLAGMWNMEENSEANGSVVEGQGPRHSKDDT
jgi:hypothetical protein